MNKLLLSIAFILCAINSFSQAKKRKAVSVIKQQTFYLNGGFRAGFGGKSRVYYEVKLPPNTVEWYYTVTTFEGDKTDINLNLVGQLTRVLDPTGLISIATQALLTPPGSKSCDVYLMDLDNAKAFYNKADQNGSTFYYLRGTARENLREGIVQIKDITSGTYYIGFRNPSGAQGIGISFEVAAIVEEVSSDAQKAVLYGNMGWNAYLSGNIEKCIELSQKALTIDSTLGYVKANLGLCYLIKNEESTATDYYINALDDIKKLQDKPTIKKYLTEVIKDINDAAAKYTSLNGSNYIKDLYEAELKQYRAFAF